MTTASRSRAPAREDAPDRAGNAIPFVDLQAQRARLGPALDAAIARVLDHGAFIMGPEVGRLEDRLAAFCGARHAIGCSSGTDAILLALMALGVTRGDAVLMPAFTFVATAEAAALLGATPVFVDVERDSFNLDPETLAAGAAAAEARGLRPVGVIAVDLFGQPADYDRIERAAEELGLWLVCDAAQSFGASWRGRAVGGIGRAATTSFYPAKPLGCYGDGGALFTDDDALAETARSCLFHGAGADRNDNVRVGLNGRLDTLQAAVLLEKLKVFEDEIARRNAVAAAYSEAFAASGALGPPRLGPGAASVWSQYTLRLDGIDRAGFRARLAAAGVPTAVYYPRPLHRQAAYRHCPAAGGALPVSEGLSEAVVSLPIHAYLDAEAQGRVIDAVRRAAA